MISKLLLLVLALFSGLAAPVSAVPSNNCYTFTVGQGTGCQYMCNLCSSQLGTDNYYFTDNVCTYESGVGCIGNPQQYKQYTCCAAGEDKDEL